ncbi:hypothetical protein SAMN02910436_00650 [Ruminococcaceae bacterium P7]|nr:hypothetical protein SAMN02910436_00650 [Ruminococcaceae bacterium P7]
MNCKNKSFEDKETIKTYNETIKRLKNLKSLYIENGYDTSNIEYQINLYKNQIYRLNKKPRKKRNSQNPQDSESYSGAVIYYPSYKRGKKIIK